MKNEVKNYGTSILFNDNEQPRAVVTYLALFNEYVIEWCNDWFENADGKFLCFHYTSNKRNKVSVKTKAMVEEYCAEHNFVIAKSDFIDHPLAHGLPDTRSIKPY